MFHVSTSLLKFIQISSYLALVKGWREEVKKKDWGMKKKDCNMDALLMKKFSRELM